MTALLRYAPYQMGDYLRERGLVTIGVGLLLGYLMSLNVAGHLGDDARRAREISPVFFSTAGGLIAWFGALTAINGIASNDRVRGYYRMLFSRPVGIVSYYLQAWLVHGLGFLLVVVVLLGVYAATVTPFLPMWLLPWVVLAWFLLGGIGFLLSAITRFDGILFVVVVLVSLILRTAMARREDAAADIVRVLTVPIDRLQSIMVAAIDERTPPGSDVMWVAGYGLAALAIGAVIIHRRELGR